MIRTAILVLLWLALGALFVRSCSGPRPRVVSARMHGDVAVVTIHNDGFGEGDVDVKFIVKGGSGPPRIRNERVELSPRQDARVQTRFEGARGDERVEAEVDYPPR